MKPHWINGEFDVQAKIGEIIARMDTAHFAILLNGLRYSDDTSDGEYLYCPHYGLTAQRNYDICKNKHDCFTCIYDFLRSDDVDLPTCDLIFDSIEELTGVHVEYRDPIGLMRKEDPDD